MKLEISQDEVESILLNWAMEKFPDQFNDVRMTSRYGSFDSVVFTKTDEPEAEEGLKAA
jgi:hypothetical protein